MKILIAYDGSSCADKALEDLRRAGLPRQADALVVNVQERWLSLPSTCEFVANVFGTTESAAVKPARARIEPESQAEAGESPLLDAAYKRIKSFFPEWNVKTLFLRGSPSYQIVCQAREWNADLIIVGSQGEKAGKINSLGSVSQKIANEVQCSVRVVRGSAWKKTAPVRILIGLDGTQTAFEAVEEVARRMWIPGSEVRLVTAKDLSEEQQAKSDLKSNTDKWIEHFQFEAERRLKDSALGVSRLVEEGDPKTLIINSADEWGADCIFIGSNDTVNFFENLLLGSVATAIVARAHCTVEIVRHQEKPSENV